MAGVKSFGRGRGWAKPHGDDVPLPKPGRLLNSKSEESIDHDDFDTAIDLVNVENVEEIANSVSRLIDDKMRTQGFKDIFGKLYKRAVKDREFGDKLVRFCYSTTIKNIYDNNGSSFFKLLINNFQIDYERREELRRKDPTEFYSVVFLLTRYTLHSKIQTRVIYHALVSYMEMLLEMHSVEDIKLFKEMIVKLGNRLQTGYKEPVKELILTCRTILIKEDVPEASRLMLLYVIDLERRGFSHLPNYLKAFYKSQLGEEYEEPLLN